MKRSGIRGRDSLEAWRSPLAGKKPGFRFTPATLAGLFGRQRHRRDQQVVAGLVCSHRCVDRRHGGAVAEFQQGTDAGIAGMRGVLAVGDADDGAVAHREQPRA